MTGTGDDAVSRQLVAYNNHDIDSFVGCYAADVVIEDGEGKVSIRGLAQLRERYTAFFSAAPAVKVELLSRIRVGAYVIDEEHVSGHPAGEVHAAAVYRIDGDALIEHVRMLT